MIPLCLEAKRWPRRSGGGERPCREPKRHHAGRESIKYSGMGSKTDFKSEINFAVEIFQLSNMDVFSEATNTASHIAEPSIDRMTRFSIIGIAQHFQKSLPPPPAAPLPRPRAGTTPPTRPRAGPATPARRPRPPTPAPPGRRTRAGPGPGTPPLTPLRRGLGPRPGTRRRRRPPPLLRRPRAAL